MKVTDNMKLRKPDSEDYVKVEDFNHNADLIDTNNENMKVVLNSKAPNNSPQFTGEPAIYDDEEKEYKKIATEKYINNRLIVKEIL